MPYWDERVQAISTAYPDIDVDKYHIDILAANFVMHPEWFDVVVASNLFGDILSDLGPACTGTIGIAPSGNINPERKFPSLLPAVDSNCRPGLADTAGRENMRNPGASGINTTRYEAESVDNVHTLSFALPRDSSTGIIRQFPDDPFRLASDMVFLQCSMRG
jgi:Isocitrate/isopropylmalate dehydrogenase